jgi:hypothetical protein
MALDRKSPALATAAVAMMDRMPACVCGCESANNGT